MLGNRHQVGSLFPFDIVFSLPLFHICCLFGARPTYADGNRVYCTTPIIQKRTSHPVTIILRRLCSKFSPGLEKETKKVRILGEDGVRGCWERETRPPSRSAVCAETSEETSSRYPLLITPQHGVNVSACTGLFLASTRDMALDLVMAPPADLTAGRFPPPG